MQPAQGTLFELISGRTRWLANRQAVLTQNIANADTPDYQPLDLRPADQRRLTAAALNPRGIALVQTAALHLQGTPAREAQVRGREVDAFETAPAGNAVVLDEQLEKLAQTQSDYELTTNLYRRQVSLLRTALGVSGG